MASGTAKLQLLIDLKNNIKTGLDSAKKQVEKACGDMQGRLNQFKIKSVEAFDTIKSEIPIVGKAFKLLKNPLLILTGLVAGVAMGFRKLKASAGEWMGLARSQIESETKLMQVMRNTMNASNAEIKSIKELAAAQQSIGVIGDEVQLSGAQELATYLTSAESLKKLMPVMNDMLAQQYGYNATQEQAINIGSMMGKVMDGQVGALSRYGYKFDEVQEQLLKYGTESERVATLMDVVSSSVGGVNAALAQTPQGKIKQIENEVGDLKEEAGILFADLKTAWLPVQEAGMMFWKTMLGFLQNHKEQIRNVITHVANLFSWLINFAIKILSGLKAAFTFIYEWRGVLFGVAAAFALINAKLIAQTIALGALKIATAAVTAAQWLFNTAAAANPIGLIVLAIGALIGGLVMAYQRFDKFRAVIQGSWEVIKGFGNILKEFVIDGLKAAFTFIYEWRGVLFGIAAAFALINAKLIAQTIALGALKIVTAAVTAAQWLFNIAAAANPIGLIVLAIGALIGGLVMAYQRFDKFRAVIQGSWEVIKGFGNILKEFVIDRIKGIISGIGSVGAAIGKLFKGDFSGAWESAKQGVMDLSGATAVKNAIENTKGLNVKETFNNKYDQVMDDAAKKKEAEKQSESPDVDIDPDGNPLFASIYPDDDRDAIILPPTESDKPSKSDPSEDAKKISGNSQTKNVTITIDSFIKDYSPTHQSVNGMNKEEFERWITEMFMRVVRSAETAV